MGKIDESDLCYPGDDLTYDSKDKDCNRCPQFKLCGDVVEVKLSINPKRFKKIHKEAMLAIDMDQKIRESEIVAAFKKANATQAEIDLKIEELRKKYNLEKRDWVAQRVINALGSAYNSSKKDDLKISREDEKMSKKIKKNKKNRNEEVEVEVEEEEVEVEDDIEEVKVEKKVKTKKDKKKGKKDNSSKKDKKVKEIKVEKKVNNGKKSKKSDSSGSRSLGIIATIADTIVNKGPVTKEQIHKILVKNFPDKAPEGMFKTINAQLGGNRMKKEKGLKIVKNDQGAFLIKKGKE